MQVLLLALHNLQCRFFIFTFIAAHKSTRLEAGMSEMSRIYMETHLNLQVGGGLWCCLCNILRLCAVCQPGNTDRQRHTGPPTSATGTSSSRGGAGWTTPATAAAAACGRRGIERQRGGRRAESGGCPSEKRGAQSKRHGCWSNAR